jgi:SAM-dependent methyltransferase
MFALHLDELRGQKILDVASGPGSFVAEALALGLDVTGCDPMYAHDAASIAAQGTRDIDACREQIRRNPGILVYEDIDHFYAEKYRALEKFAADFRHRSGERRYIAGALPELPFDDEAFEVVLSANFLMIYAPLADGGMHTWTQPPQPHPYCEPAVAELEGLGFEVALVPSDYDDGCQGSDGCTNQVLVARRCHDAGNTKGRA